MSKEELNELRKQALSTLEKSQPLTSEELAEKLNQDHQHVREAVWKMVNRNEVEFTHDWKIKVAELVAA